jgi:metal-dependent hydrolase (beta-lactamase superfamily II)/predicted TIM-barrel fold metal-dependent hydrolase
MRRGFLLLASLVLVAAAPHARFQAPAAHPSARPAAAPADAVSPAPAPGAVSTPSQGAAAGVRITYLYDNTTSAPGTKGDWGFACLVEANGRRVLFDTGANPEVLRANLAALRVDLGRLDALVFSHDHGDHTAGVAALGARPGLPTFFPSTFSERTRAAFAAQQLKLTPADVPTEIVPGMMTGGRIGTAIPEHALVADSPQGLVVVVGCAHPGIADMLRSISTARGRQVHAVIGGFHLLQTPPERVAQIVSEIRAMGVAYVGPTHCTGDAAIERFRQAYAGRFIEGGVGRVVTLPMAVPAKEGEAATLPMAVPAKEGEAATLPMAVPPAKEGEAATLPMAVPAKEGEAATLTADQVMRMPKIDAHAHLALLEAADRKAFVGFLERIDLRWLTIATGGMDASRLDQQIAASQEHHRAAPGRIGWATSFHLSGWGGAGWADAARKTLADGFAHGAVAVKIWKDVGMELKDADGRYVMADDRRLDPVYEFTAAERRPLVAHLGEPRNCWLPVEQMTVQGDRHYFAEHPQYHGFLHPEVPDYEKQLAARDAILERHPTLRVVGCHLGSLEYDVDELAKRLDRYPNLAVDLAARIVHFQVQPREKVRAFILRYQDRILYGTDFTFGRQGAGAALDVEQELAEMEAGYRLDAEYFATGAEMELPRVRPGHKARGLALPAAVLRKIYFENARAWYPRLQ